MTRNISLKVYVFFKEESLPASLIKKGADSLQGKGVDVSISFNRETSEEEIKKIKENTVLAIFDTPEKAGRFAFLAGKAGKKGLALSGRSAYGISLEEENILSFFQNEEFHSAFFYAADWAFPVISDSAPDQEREPFLLSIYRGLMLYAAGKENTLLAAMDRGRR
ncbi:hypothetical protein [uncultured Dialister sp.]|uniref:hypothetical protein n=1 Tax=uncultured Dialister sp. TaxID=278064 RepID=UPI002608D6BC|nr:hypothetical protein [uncultured Dialister sp.]